MVLREDVTTTICYHENQEAVISIKPKFLLQFHGTMTKEHTVIPSCWTAASWLRNRSMLFPGRVAQIDFSLVACRGDRFESGSHEWWKGKMRLLSFVVCYTTRFHQEFIMKLIEVSIHRPVNMYIYIYIFPYCIWVQVFSSSSSTTHIVSGLSFSQGFAGWSFWRPQNLSITTICQSHTLW